MNDLKIEVKQSLKEDNWFTRWLDIFEYGAIVGFGVNLSTKTHTFVIFTKKEKN